MCKVFFIQTIMPYRYGTRFGSRPTATFGRPALVAGDPPPPGRPTAHRGRPTNTVGDPWAAPTRRATIAIVTVGPARSPAPRTLAQSAAARVRDVRRHRHDDAAVGNRQQRGYRPAQYVAVVTHRARGRVLWTRRNGFPYLEAVRAFRRAIGLNPGSATALGDLGLVYNHIGLLDPALAATGDALAIDPSRDAGAPADGVCALVAGASSRGARRAAPHPSRVPSVTKAEWERYRTALAADER
jgi:hypothetical protein